MVLVSTSDIRVWKLNPPVRRHHDESAMYVFSFIRMVYSHEHDLYKMLLQIARELKTATRHFVVDSQISYMLRHVPRLNEHSPVPFTTRKTRSPRLSFLNTRTRTYLAANSPCQLTTLPIQADGTLRVNPRLGLHSALY